MVRSTGRKADHIGFNRDKGMRLAFREPGGRPNGQIQLNPDHQRATTANAPICNIGKAAREPSFQLANPVDAPRLWP